jgi:hypothetical protein
MTKNIKCCGGMKPKSKNKARNHLSSWMHKYPFLKVLFPVTGLLALCWFLIRVIPKPSRATYPCQRITAPLASSFIIWIISLLSSTFAYRNAKDLLRRSFWFKASLLFTVALTAAGVALYHMPEQPVKADDSQPNIPIGTAKGIHPGRVVWVYDPNATNWDGYQSPEHWWESNHTDINVVENMLRLSIRGVTGDSNDSEAWDAIFRYFNNTHGKGDVGYQPGEKIMIKVNLTTCAARNNVVDPNTYDKRSNLMNQIDNSPQMLLSLLRQLVSTVGVDQNDITIGDPTGMMPNPYWNMLHPEFPNVHYLDNYGGSGRTRAEFSDVPFNWSSPDANGKLQDYLPISYAQAKYLINFAILKGHSAGVSLCAKNNYGSLLRCPDGYLRDSGYLNYYNMHNSLPNASWSPGMGHYRAIVDIMGHPDLGGKTVLYLIDGLFGGYYWEAHPYKWLMTPFGDGNNGDWPSSVFASLDPVAIDSVAYDFLLREWPSVVANPGLEGAAEDYLHEAALADNPPSGMFYDPDKDGLPMQSLGIHEHWNNSTDKQYSRNLWTGTGIELVKLPSQLKGDLNYDAKIDSDDLIRLAGQWLWTGDAGSIAEDIVQDGTVNFLDFAVLAGDWMKQ